MPNQSLLSPETLFSNKDPFTQKRVLEGSFLSLSQCTGERIKLTFFEVTNAF